MYKDYGILHNDMTHEGNMFIEDNTDVLKYEYNDFGINGLFSNVENEYELEHDYNHYTKIKNLGGKYSIF